MRYQKELTLSKHARNVALVSSFASLYAIFSLWSLFPIIGSMGKFITVAAIAAPLIGIMLGPRLGAATVALGGIVAVSVAQIGPFGPVSFIPGTAAAYFSGLLYNRRRRISAVLYSISLLMFAFYPRIGPAWLHPYFIWLHLVGLIILMSPLQLKGVELARKHTKLSESTFEVGVFSFLATLFSHIVGSMMFEMVYYPIIIPGPDSWKSLWQALTFVYPIERAVITTMDASVGAALIRALKAYGFKLGGR